MFKFLYTGCNMYPEYNQKIGKTRNLEEIINIAQEMKDKMKDVKMEDKYGWYMRHRKNEKNLNNINDNNEDDIDNENKEQYDINENNINNNDEDIEINSLF